MGEPMSEEFRFYEQRARHAAADLLDDFSMETVLGFQFLARYYWGEDLQKYQHYRNISRSLGQQILQSNKQLTSRVLDMLVRIQLVTLDMTDLIDYNLDRNLRDTLNEIEPALAHVRVCQDVHTPNIDQLLEWLNFRVSLVKCASALNGEEAAFPFREDPQEFVRLKRAASVIQRGVQAPNLSAHRSFVCLMCSFVAFVGGQRAEAISCIREASSLLSAQELPAMSSPYFWHLLHSAVHIAINQGELELAHQLNTLQSKIGTILPTILPRTNSDRELLRRHLTLAQERAYRPHGKRPLFASTDFLWGSHHRPPL